MFIWYWISDLTGSTNIHGAKTSMDLPDNGPSECSFMVPPEGWECE